MRRRWLVRLASAPSRVCGLVPPGLLPSRTLRSRLGFSQAKSSAICKNLARPAVTSDLHNLGQLHAHRVPIFRASPVSIECPIDRLLPDAINPHGERVQLVTVRLNLDVPAVTAALDERDRKDGFQCVALSAACRGLRKPPGSTPGRQSQATPVTVSAGMPGPLSSTVSPSLLATTVMTGAMSASSHASMALSKSSLSA